jgi:hypothetical protein
MGYICIPELIAQNLMLDGRDVSTKLRVLLRKLNNKEHHHFHGKLASLLSACNRKIASGKKLDIVGDLDGPAHSKTEENADLGKLLHCEQMVLLNLLCYERTFNALLDDAIVDDGSQDKDASLPSGDIDESQDKVKKAITSVSLDIITYNDMCRNCFSTCYNFWDDFKAIISKFLGRENFDFKIVISSLKPYGSPLTRSIDKKEFPLPLHELEVGLLSRPANKVNDEKSDKKIIQFVNPWLFERMIISISRDISASVAKSTTTYEIELQGKRLKELEKIISNRYYERLDFDVKKINGALVKTREDIKNAFYPMFEKLLTVSSELRIFYPENALSYLDGYYMECMKIGITNVKAFAAAIGYNTIFHY